MVVFSTKRRRGGGGGGGEHNDSTDCSYLKYSQNHKLDRKMACTKR